MSAAMIRPGHGVQRGRFVGVAVAAALIAAAFALFARPGEANAHPLGNFTVNRYARVELYRGQALVHYVLDFAEIPSVQLTQQIDTDGDDELSAAELDVFARRLAGDTLGGLSLSAGGERLPLTVLESAATSSSGQGGLPIIRLAVLYGVPVEESGLAAIDFSDENYAERPGWREIVVRPSPGTVSEVEQRFSKDRSEALRSYPSGEPVASDSRVAFTWDTATGASVPPGSAVIAAQDPARRGGDRFSRLLQSERSLGVILLSLVAAFGFGALHALGPGHGKSVVAAYLVGARGTPRHALALGVTVTATHTAAVYALGFLTLVASDLVAPDRVFLYLGVASGALIVAMGLALLAGRLRALLRPAPDGDVHRHGLFGRAHSHMPHAHAHPHEHYDHAHTSVFTETAEAGAETRVTWKGLVTLGVAGGLIPCPSALVVMLAAISLGQVLFGMLLIVAFSVGLATVLVAIGLALVLGRHLAASAHGPRSLLAHPALSRAVAFVPVVSAIAVTLAGLGITYQAWNQPGL